jgi:hypothetical protein
MRTVSNSQEVVPKGRSAKRVPSLLGCLLIYLGLLIIVLMLVWLAIKAHRVYTTYRAMAPHLASLQSLASAGRANPTELDLAQLEDSLRGTASGLETLSDELGPFLPLTRYMGWVPSYGGDIQAAPYLLAAARDLSQAGVILFERFSPLLEHPSSGEQGDILPQAVMTFAQGQSDLDQAEKLLQQAQASLDEVDSQRLSPQVARRIAPLQAYLPSATSGLAVAKRLPSLLGAESPRTYLILAQNMDEMRPTGGYINAAGHVVVDRGKIVEFDMEDSYAVDQLSEAYPYPPGPIRRYMAADYWLLRDANWSPDFPTSARTAIALYELGRGISADGVIAFDQQALVYLLRALEPLVVDGEQVTNDNVIQLMRQHWAPDPDLELGEWWSQRKSFMVALSEGVRHKLEQEPGSIEFSVLADGLQQALAEKHILVYLKDPVVADFMAGRNWTGSLQEAQGDYLMVVDANLGFNKASALVERRLNYHVTLGEDGSAQAQAHLVYQHPAQKRIEDCWQEPRYDPVYEQNMERCYWDYLRLVVPARANLISGPRVVVDGRYLLGGETTSGEIDIAPLGPDKLSWGQLFLLAPGESISLDYSYTLPPGTARRMGERWTYSLYLQKQPGTVSSPVEVTVTLPEGAQLLESQPRPEGQKDTLSTYLSDLSIDRKIEISYRLP